MELGIVGTVVHRTDMIAYIPMFSSIAFAVGAAREAVL